MQVRQVVLHAPGHWAALDTFGEFVPQLVLVFGSLEFFQTTDLAQALQDRFPTAIRVGCSTAGEVTAQGVGERTCTVTAVCFDATPLVSSQTALQGMADAYAAGERLAQALPVHNLHAVLVLGPGVHMNGSALVDGMAHVLGAGVPITGGLAADGGAFSQTHTLCGSQILPDGIVAVGLYGSAIRVGHGSFGGWSPFGISRRVTRAEGNILYELDGKPALEVYKRYLGDYAKDLPTSGLLFPFAMQRAQGEEGDAVIRTILGLNEADGSLILAGDIDPNGSLKLMQASTDRLVDGAEMAAASAHAMLSDTSSALAILVSCVGRKLVMGDRVDEEIESVVEALGRQVVLTGFYSNGEICPSAPGRPCGLHNQTMTITLLGERQ